MAFRSKYQHVYMKEMKDNLWLSRIRPKDCSWDSNNVDVSSKLCAVSYTGGGGCVGVFGIDKFTRVETHHKISAHSSRISDLKFSPFHPNVLATGSQDCTIRLWEVPDGGLVKDMSKEESKQEFQGHLRPVGSLCFHPTCDSVLVSGSIDKTVKLWDVTQGKAMLNIPLGTKTLDVALHFDFNSTGNVMAMVAKNKNLFLVDPRAETPIVSETKCFDTPRGIRCLFLKDKDMILATGNVRGNTRTAKLYDMKDLSKPVSTKELDLGAGILMSFYDEDLGIIYIGGKGEGMIRYFDIAQGKLDPVNTYQTNKAQKGLCMIHKIGVNTMDHEVGRFYKLTENAVIPLRVLFPRKNTLFQPDLFPDTKGFVPIGGPDEFFGGAELTKEIEKISLEPGKRPEGFVEEQTMTISKQKAKAVKQDAPYEYWKKEELITKLRKVEEELKLANQKLLEQE